MELHSMMGGSTITMGGSSHEKREQKAVYILAILRKKIKGKNITLFSFFFFSI